MIMTSELAKEKIIFSPFDINLSEFPSNAIKSITFGCRITEDDLQELKRLLKDNAEYSKVTMHQANIDLMEFKLNFENVE